jgi:hypothetical protein
MLLTSIEFLDDSRFFTILVATVEPCFTSLLNSCYMIIECAFDISLINVWSCCIYWFRFSSKTLQTHDGNLFGG